MHSCLQYYGGKTYMVDTIINNFPSQFEYKTYVEGFGGGASVLWKKTPDPIEVYNDLEKNVYSVFKVISNKEMFERFKEKMDLTPYSRELWEEYKEILKTDLSLEDRAYYFFYVNKASFNGVGGFSVCKNDVRRNMMKTISDYLSTVDHLYDYHQRISRAVVENLNIFDLIDKYDSPTTFFYLDPPYVQSTRLSNQKYRKEFSDEEHKKLVEKCNNIKGKVLISGYDHPIYDGLEGFTKIQFKSPNAKSNATETLWKNY